ncbi:DNA (cytosine-5)-methyltransferase 1B-like [Actinidia eriantha]|uniref:DNA (cytosine-5)-methyltransferase 1B-like n=1 Tax=Actinidia eriantha TaxID=165200 RepID=UPI00258FEE27|nr:DNA (cytosine-5)-methyltransferase 1B-like [Actinidia eriantha]
MSPDRAYVLPSQSLFIRFNIKMETSIISQTHSFSTHLLHEHRAFCLYFNNIFLHLMSVLALYGQLPDHIRLSVVDEATKRKKKGKFKEGGNSFHERKDDSSTNRLATLDIFAGCDGLSEGLQQAGASLTKWAIEYEEPAGEAVKLNHPKALMLIKNCNVILRWKLNFA